MKGQAIWVHSYLISSGKEHKLIEKPYFDREKAYENHKLLGGVLREAIVINKKGKL